MGQIIRLSENRLHELVSESVKRIISEDYYPNHWYEDDDEGDYIIYVRTDGGAKLYAEKISQREKSDGYFVLCNFMGDAQHFSGRNAKVTAQNTVGICNMWWPNVGKWDYEPYK